MRLPLHVPITLGSDEFHIHAYGSELFGVARQDIKVPKLGFQETYPCPQSSSRGLVYPIVTTHVVSLEQKATPIFNGLTSRTSPFGLLFSDRDVPMRKLRCLIKCGLLSRRSPIHSAISTTLMPSLASRVEDKEERKIPLHYLSKMSKSNKKNIAIVGGKRCASAS